MTSNVVIVLLLINVSVILAAPNASTRIIGGSTTTINSYPYLSSLIHAPDGITFSQYCAGSIITTSAILTAAQCLIGKNINLMRARAGSSYANTGGAVYNFRQGVLHPSFNSRTLDFDVAVLRTATPITYVPNIVAAASIAGPNYNLGDNQVVWAVGWGYTSVTGPSSELLRHVQIWTVNQATCRSRYLEVGLQITDNMVCSGWLDYGGRDQCTGDSGGPLLHNNVVVGICSWGQQCALPRYPGVNTRVSRFTSWIQSVAS